MKQYIRFYTLLLALGVSYPLQAQTVTVPFTFAGTSPVALQMDSYGNLSSLGTYGTGTFSLAGAGTRMFWYPGKAAFRAGYVSGTDWNDSNIGAYSTAFGQDTTASGTYSFASGYASSASGPGAISIGYDDTASGSNSIAIGYFAYATSGGISIGGGDVLAGNAVVIGGGQATGGWAFAIQGGLASGYYANAFGNSTNVSGSNATAFGISTTASSYSSFVAGRYNVGGGNNSSWVATDPLFELGNGATSSAKADALVVYKSGNAQVHGTFRCAAGGDLSMGSFTAGTAP